MSQAVVPSVGTGESTPLATRLRRRWRALPTILRFGLAGGTTQVVYLSVLAAALATHMHYLAALIGAAK